MRRFLIAGLFLLCGSISYADIAVTQGSGKTVATETAASREFQQIVVSTLNVMNTSSVPTPVGYQTGGSSVPVNVLNTVTISGSLTANQSVNVSQVGSNNVQTNGSGIQLISADIAGTSNTVTAVGAAANAASASGNPLRDGGDAHTALPSAVSDAQNVANFNDKFGRRVTISDCPRDLMVLSTMTLTSTTSELVFISSGGASVFNDIVNLIAINTSATAAELDFRSKGGPAANATIDIPLYLPAGDTRGIAAGHVLTQQTANANWTVQSSASVASIKISAWYCQNK